ncbi:MAG TPA: S41 family peptidase [Pyrinomonadaceae bacterium]|nr:S41 family peptidase [Pyrinomonadaceae bacterium]
MSFRSKFLLVVMSATLALYAVVGGWMSSSAQQQQNDPGAQLRIFESVLRHIQDDYVDEPDLNKVRAGALRGLAYGLDPYSTYLTTEQVKDFRATSGTPGSTPIGIGAELSQFASYLYVIAPVKGGPADQAGLQVGDIIEYIDGKATRDISLYDARQLLNGATGSEVKLRVLRSGTRPFVATVRRSAVQVPGAEAKMEAGRIGVIKVNSLAEGESADVKARLQELLKQGAQKIVLDLRSVAGGSLAEGVKVSNYFIREGSLAQTIGRGNKVLKTYNAEPKDALFDGPASVLIDRGTAAAAEIVASAFAEHKRGDVVGVRSFGAGAEQQLFTLRAGDGLLLTTIKWASSTGKAFLGEGVKPSVEVKPPDVAEAIDPEDLTGNDDDAIAQPQPNAPADRRDVAPDAAAPKQQPEDVQLKKALELLREKSTQTPAQRPS